MTDDLRVAVYPADEGGCGHYRMIWPARAANLAVEGVQVLIEDAPNIECLWSEDWSQFEVPPSWVHPIAIPDPPRVEVVVLQRPMLHWKVEMIPLLQQAGVAVVVEIDDDFDQVHRRNPAWPGCEPDWLSEEESKALAERMRATGQGQLMMKADGTWMGRRWVQVVGYRSSAHRGNAREACRLADMVICSTPALARRYGKHGRVAILENQVPSPYLAISQWNLQWRDEIGWAGSPTVHQGDLDQVRFPLRQMINGDPRLRFRAFGSMPGQMERILDLPPGERVRYEPPVSLVDYPAEVAQFGVGIAPLEDSAFNRAKSWLKPLEYAALGVPWVGSPLPEYQRFAQESGGLLARTATGWTNALRHLMNNDRAWQDARQAGIAAASRHTYELQAWRWAEAWQQAVTNRIKAFAGRL